MPLDSAKFLRLLTALAAMCLLAASCWAPAEGGESSYAASSEPPAATFGAETVESRAESKAQTGDTGKIIPVEADYVPAGEGFHSVGVARYNFWLTIPERWRAFDTARNGDGYYLDCGNEGIDARTYGGNYLPEVEQDGYPHREGQQVTDFVFDSGTVGVAVLLPEQSVRYLYIQDGRVITFFVNFSQDPDWYEANRTLLEQVAGTLRDGKIILE